MSDKTGLRNEPFKYRPMVGTIIFIELRSAQGHVVLSPHKEDWSARRVLKYQVMVCAIIFIKLCLAQGHVC